MPNDEIEGLCREIEAWRACNDDVDLSLLEEDVREYIALIAINHLQLKLAAMKEEQANA